MYLTDCSSIRNRWIGNHESIFNDLFYSKKVSFYIISCPQLIWINEKLVAIPPPWTCLSRLLICHHSFIELAVSRIVPERFIIRVLNLCFDPPSLYSMSFSLFQLPLRSYLFALGSMLRDASFTDQRSDLSTTTVHTVPASTRPDTDYNTCRSTPSPITPMRWLQPVSQRFFGTTGSRSDKHCFPVHITDLDQTR